MESKNDLNFLGRRGWLLFRKFFSTCYYRIWARPHAQDEQTQSPSKQQKRQLKKEASEKIEA